MKTRPIRPPAASFSGKRVESAASRRMDAGQTRVWTDDFTNLLRDTRLLQ
jgi:hypothetical protein